MIDWQSLQDATCVGLFLAVLYIGFEYVRERIKSRKRGFKTITKYDISD